MAQNEDGFKDEGLCKHAITKIENIEIFDIILGDSIIITGLETCQTCQAYRGITIKYDLSNETILDVEDFE
jgi:hypothetical protein